MQPLPGFRDFLPNECAIRNYIFTKWREVARRYGFVEWDGPILEPTELYTKKSGPEIVAQLFHFTDKGDRAVAMRPELTPTLARVVAAHDREFKKPLKWFSIPQCFRYEKQQRGRLREHYQLNCDIVGEVNVAADVELVCLAIDILRSLGFSENDFVVRLSERLAWADYFAEKGGDVFRVNDFYQLIDKIDRQPRTLTEMKLKELHMDPEHVWNFIEDPAWHSGFFGGFKDLLAERGMDKFVEFDPKIVRGLDYYTGIVFEVFDRQKKLRALAGGGRYDNLIHQLSDGAVSLPALGFAMGDVVLGELIAENPVAKTKMESAIAAQQRLDIYVVIAKEERRTDALAKIQALRDDHYRVDYPLTAAKVGKQFQTAEQLGARVAILFGDEWPEVKIKNMSSGEQMLIAPETIALRLSEIFDPSS